MIKPKSKFIKKSFAVLVATVCIVTSSCGSKDDLITTGPYMMQDNSIVCESDYIAYITDDNRVYIAYSDGTGEYVPGFDSVVQLSGGECELVALNSDGKLVFYDLLEKCILEKFPDWEEISSGFELGGNNVSNLYNFQNELLELDSISNIHMEYPEWYVCNTKDGDVLINGVNWLEEDIAVVESWKDVVKYKSYTQNVIGLKSDGTILSHIYENEESDIYNSDDSDVSEWKDIVDIDCGFYFFGLESDGTVITNGWYSGECNVQDWQDIVQISAVPNTTVGLRNNKTVEVAYELDSGQSEATSWKDIILVKAADDYVLGIKDDKTIVVTLEENRAFDFTNAPAPFIETLS